VKKNIKVSLLFKIVIPFIVSVAGVAYYALFIVYMPQHDRMLKDKLLLKGKVTLNNTQPYIGKAIDAKDDLSLMACMQNIMKDNDFMYARVLNSSGTVVAHNNINEWGTNYSGTLTKKIVSSGEMLISERKNPDGFDCALPFAENLFLTVGLSDLKMKALCSQKREEVKQLLLFITISASAVGFLYYWVFAVLPLKRLKVFIDSVTMGKLEERLFPLGSAEVASIARSINLLLDRATKELAQNKNSAEAAENNLIVSLHNVCSLAAIPFLCVDINGKVVSKSEMGIPFAVKQGDMIIEATDDKEFLKTFRDSQNKVNEIFELTTKNYKSRFLTIKNVSNKAIETLIVFRG